MARHPERAKMEKWQVASVWRAHLNRQDPQNLGTIEWPQPKPEALAGLKFLHTGEYDTIERDSLYELLRGCSGRVYSGMSKNLDYLLVGREAGPAKLKDAELWGLKMLTEEECYNFLKDKIDNFNPADVPNVDTKPKTKAEKKAPAKPVIVKPAKKVPIKTYSKMQTKTEKVEGAPMAPVVPSKAVKKGRGAKKVVEEQNGNDVEVPVVKPKVMKESTVTVKTVKSKAKKEPIKTYSKMQIKEETVEEPPVVPSKSVKKGRGAKKVTEELNGKSVTEVAAAKPVKRGRLPAMSTEETPEKAPNRKKRATRSNAVDEKFVFLD